MGKKKDLTPRKRAQLAILVKEEYKSVDIARKLDLSKAAVSKLRKKLRNGESTSPKKKNSGRQKATTAREDGIMRREVLKNRRMTEWHKNGKTCRTTVGTLAPEPFEEDS